MTMSLYAVEMPKWGMTMEEGLVTGWLASEGDEVAADQSVIEVESSKIAGEVTAGHAGVLARLVAKVDDELPVGALLAVVADAGTADDEIDAFVAEHGGGAAAPPEPEAKPTADSVPAEQAARPAPEKAAPAAAPAAGRRGRTAPAHGEERSAVPSGSGVISIPVEFQGADETEVPATPHAADLATEHGIALSRVTATGRGERVTVADLVAAVEDAGGSLPFGNDRERVAAVFSHRDDSGVPATPHARSLAEEAGVNLNDARPTGTQGRVTVADVEAVIARRASMTGAPVSGPGADAEPSVPAEPSSPGNAVTEVPMSQMRKVIASRLHDSYLDAPHFRVSVRAEIDELLALRRQVNDVRRDAKMSVNDLVVAAVARALVGVPGLNAQYDPEAQVVRHFEHADVSVAVSTSEGLITPIVTRADTRTVTEVSALVHDLATRAKTGTLKPDEFQGGTFTVSNLGMFGVSDFDAIINPPQVAILSVGAARRTFVPDEDGDPRVATLLPLTLSSDHRVVDGALAARFCAELQRLLESPALILA